MVSAMTLLLTLCWRSIAAYKVGIHRATSIFTMRTGRASSSRWESWRTRTLGMRFRLTFNGVRAQCKKRAEREEPRREHRAPREQGVIWLHDSVFVCSSEHSMQPALWAASTLGAAESSNYFPCRSFVNWYGSQKLVFFMS